MNRIEEQWHQLKTHEIAGQMFEDEYDLAMAVIQGMETRGRSGEYTLERLSLNPPSYLLDEFNTDSLRDESLSCISHHFSDILLRVE